MNEATTQEEKIDYIYNTLRKNERKALFGVIFKWGFRIFMIWYLIYFIKVGLPLIIDSFMSNMSGSSWVAGSINPDQIKSAIWEYFSK